jgi:hypothetical protein
MPEKPRLNRSRGKRISDDRPLTKSEEQGYLEVIEIFKQLNKEKKKKVKKKTGK